MKTLNANVNPEMIAEIIEKFGLYWTVKKERLLLPDGTDSGFFGTVRQDTKETFTAVKEGYEVFQNWELAEVVSRVAGETGFKINKGGSFNGGGKVYLQLEMPAKNVGNDRVKRWATGINSHDGSSSLAWGSTHLTISCQNTFWSAYKTLDNKFRHTSNIKKAVEESLRQIERINEEEKTLFEVFGRMAETNMTKENVQKVIEMVTDVDVTMKTSEAEEKYSTRKLNKARDLTESIVTETASKGQTLWGLWSGVTHFTTHKAGADKNRDRAKAIGSLRLIDNKVFDTLGALVN